MWIAIRGNFHLRILFGLLIIQQKDNCTPYNAFGDSTPYHSVFCGLQFWEGVRIATEILHYNVAIAFHHCYNWSIEFGDMNTSWRTEHIHNWFVILTIASDPACSREVGNLMSLTVKSLITEFIFQNNMKALVNVKDMRC